MVISNIKLCLYYALLFLVTTYGKTKKMVKYLKQEQLIPIDNYAHLPPFDFIHQNFMAHVLLRNIRQLISPDFMKSCSYFICMLQDKTV